MQRRRDVGHGRGKRSGMEGHGPPCMHAGLHIRQALSPAAAAVWTPPELPPPRACSRGLESCAVFLHFVRGALQGLFWAECQASCAPPGAGCLSRTLPSPAPGGCPGIAAGCRAGGTGACSVGWAGGREPEQVALGGRLSRLPHAGPALGSAPGGCALATCHAGEGGGGQPSQAPHEATPMPKPPQADLRLLPCPASRHAAPELAEDLLPRLAERGVPRLGGLRARAQRAQRGETRQRGGRPAAGRQLQSLLAGRRGENVGRAGLGMFMCGASSAVALRPRLRRRNARRVQHQRRRGIEDAARDAAARASAPPAALPGAAGRPAAWPPRPPPAAAPPRACRRSSPVAALARPAERRAAGRHRRPGRRRRLGWRASARPGRGAARAGGRPGAGRARPRRGPPAAARQSSSGPCMYPDSKQQRVCRGSCSTARGCRCGPTSEPRPASPSAAPGDAHSKVAQRREQAQLRAQLDAAGAAELEARQGQVRGTAGAPRGAAGRRQQRGEGQPRHARGRAAVAAGSGAAARVHIPVQGELAQLGGCRQAGGQHAQRCRGLALLLPPPHVQGRNEPQAQRAQAGHAGAQPAHQAVPLRQRCAVPLRVQPGRGEGGCFRAGCAGRAAVRPPCLCLNAAWLLAPDPYHTTSQLLINPTCIAHAGQQRLELCRHTSSSAHAAEGAAEARRHWRQTADAPSRSSRGRFAKIRATRASGRSGKPMCRRGGGRGRKGRGPRRPMEALRDC